MALTKSITIIYGILSLYDDSMATTIQVKKDTREKLKHFGHKGESYDDILKRLMDYCEELDIEEFIEARWKRLQEEKDEYVPLDEI